MRDQRYSYVEQSIMGEKSAADAQIIVRDIARRQDNAHHEYTNQSVSDNEIPTGFVKQQRTLSGSTCELLCAQSTSGCSVFDIVQSQRLWIENDAQTKECSGRVTCLRDTKRTSALQMISLPTPAINRMSA
jgi:hypothetical protein